MVAALLSFACSLQIEGFARLPSVVPVLAVVMPMTLSRTRPAPGLAEFGPCLACAG